MQNVFILSIIVNIFGVILVSIALHRFKETEEEHKKISNDDFLSESEKIVQNKSIKILIIGLLIICISALINLILFIIVK